MKLDEKIYGNLATVYHGTQSDYSLFYRKRFAPGNGSGSMYGDGIYTVYELRQGSNTVKGTYGKTVIEMMTSTYKVVNFNILYDVFLKYLNDLEADNMYDFKKYISDEIKYIFHDDVYGSEIELFLNNNKQVLFFLFENKEDIFKKALSSMGFDDKFYSKFGKWLNETGWFYFIKTYYHDFITLKGRYTSRIAKPFSDDFYENLCGNGTKPLINGIIFDGVRDGPVMVIYNLNNYIPKAYFEINESNNIYERSNWKIIEKGVQTDFLDKQKEFFKTHRLGGKTEILPDNAKHKDKILFYILKEIYRIGDAPRSKTPSYYVNFIKPLSMLKKSGYDFFDLSELEGSLDQFQSEYSDEHVGRYNDTTYTFLSKADLESIDYFLNQLSNSVEFLVYKGIFRISNTLLLKELIVNYNYIDLIYNKYPTKEANRIFSDQIKNLLGLNYNWSDSDAVTKNMQKIFKYILDKYLLSDDEDMKVLSSEIFSYALANKGRGSANILLLLVKDNNIKMPIDLNKIETVQAIDLIITGYSDFNFLINNSTGDSITKVNFVWKLLQKSILNVFEDGRRKMIENSELIWIPATAYLMNNDPDEIHDFTHVRNNFKTERKQMNVLDYVYALIHIYLFSPISNYEMECILDFTFYASRKEIYLSLETFNGMLSSIIMDAIKGGDNKHGDLLALLKDVLAKNLDHYNGIVEHLYEDNSRTLFVLMDTTEKKRPDLTKIYPDQEMNIQYIRDYFRDIMLMNESKYMDILQSYYGDDETEDTNSTNYMNTI
jgi:hypothetical protein